MQQDFFEKHPIIAMALVFAFIFISWALVWELHFISQATDANNRASEAREEFFNIKK